jgi:TetR/AcrR family transcriptional regulator, transcriptional repressor for nem operon
MEANRTDKRSRLLQAALSLAHRQGFGASTLADIAEEAKVPLGNVYYYFRTKEEIGEAIVEQRLRGFSVMRQKWDELPSPRERLQAFIKMTVANRETLARSGCPLGTLCSELHKEGGALAKRAAVLFAEPLAWMETQFRALGKGKDSRGLALHLLSALQGVSVLAHNFHDPDLVSTEAARLTEWIQKSMRGT